MKILALDIGAGTEDILLYDDEKEQLENCIKMVLPSPSLVLAKKVESLTRHRKNLFIKGDTIGGGAFAHALLKHVGTGLGVYMTETAAYTIRNDLSEIDKLGIQVTGEDDLKPFQGENLVIKEVNIDGLQGFLTAFGETLSDLDVVAIAVQDHGVSPKGMKNRQFRVQKMMETLTVTPKPEAFAFMEDEIPKHFLRMKSAARAAKRQLSSVKVLLMDTSIDAILGCLKDPSIKDSDPILAVNMGNGHTIAAIVSRGEITAIMEHHTRLLNPQKIEKNLVNFVDGKLSNEEILKDKGHGLFFLTDPPGVSNIEKIVVTGPQRNLLTKSNLPIHFAAPGGDVMMTGPIGLVEATLRRLNEK